MFETKITKKILVDSGTIQYLSVNRELIRNYYVHYSEYQTRSEGVLPSYKKYILLLPLDNGFLKLANVCSSSDLGFNFIGTIQLGNKRVEMWL